MCESALSVNRSWNSIKNINKAYRTDFIFTNGSFQTDINMERFNSHHNFMLLEPINMTCFYHFNKQPKCSEISLIEQWHTEMYLRLFKSCNKSPLPMVHAN